MGGALFMQERQYSNIAEATSFALGGRVGWFLAIAAIAAIREKIRYSHVPAPLKGLGITFIITGLMGIAFHEAHPAGHQDRRTDMDPGFHDGEILITLTGSSSPSRCCLSALLLFAEGEALQKRPGEGPDQRGVEHWRSPPGARIVTLAKRRSSCPAPAVAAAPVPCANARCSRAGRHPADRSPYFSRKEARTTGAWPAR